MLRLFGFRNSRKGQWFLISAVMISGVFVVISLVFKNYALVDTSSVADMDENRVFTNIKENMDKIASSVTTSDCNPLATSTMNLTLAEFRNLATAEFAKTGYFVYIDYTITSCSSRQITKEIVVASDRMVLSEGIDPSTVLKK